MKIEEYIKKGMEKAYRENLVLKTSFDELQPKIIEYLFTINIAQQLLKWNDENSFLYSIHLEYDANKFLNDAFINKKIERDNNILSEQTIIERNLHKLSRNKYGQIDIAITKHENNLLDQERAKFAIEIKAINQNEKKIKDDIIRLYEILAEKDNISDNSVEKGFLVFIERLDNSKKIAHENDYKDLKNNRLKHWHNILINEFGTYNVQADIECFNIYNCSVEDYIKKLPVEDISYNQLIDNTGFVTGFIITFTK
ncbi:MAG: hypothetical protein DRJ01_15340 [Bacteroidetes bacterium]|nr:MAG: hypothetical protein DRJ01_15340 [Bacteroidota bacterium]